MTVSDDDTDHEAPDGVEPNRSPESKGRVRSLLTGDIELRPDVADIERLARGDIDDSGRAIWKNHLDRPAAGRLGIACSGGGIRSASYALGALQVLRREGVLEETDYLASVSGGGYTTVAHAITAALTEDEATFETPAEPWAPGTPEETHLRNHTTYLAAGTSGRVWLGLNVVYGMALNLLSFLLVVFVVGRLVGWSYVDGPIPLHPELLEGGGSGDIDFGFAWWAVAGWGFPLAGVALLGLRRFLNRFRSRSPRAMRLLQTYGVVSVAVGVVLFVYAIALPAAIEGLREISERRDLILGGFQNFLDRTVPEAEIPEVNAWAIVGFLVSVAGAVISMWRGVSRPLARRAMSALAWVAGPLLLLIPLVVVVNGAAAAGVGGFGTETIGMIVALALLGVISVFGHNARWSMHPFYKEQLSSAFVVHRVPDPDTGDPRAEPVAYERFITFSDLEVPSEGPAALPELVVCAAVNVSDDVVPPGRNAGTFTFTAARSGGPLTEYVDTEVLERYSHNLLTLPAMMAISGAAVSPSMGKMRGFSVYRFLFALFNVRLGVWLPNPRRLRALAERDAARLPTGIARAWRWLWARWKQPGPLYLFYEALGLNSLRRHYLYVTDGGHWENLGLVELLRRGCTEIVCFDASGDDVEHFSTLGEAVQLARAELRVEIDIDPAGDGLLAGDDGRCETDHVVGNFTYPDGTRGTLVYAKAALPHGLPWDLEAFRQTDAGEHFPSDTTADQFFDDRQFEAYRALGAHTARNAVAALRHERQGH